MADNTTLPVGTGGDTIATDDIGGVKYQRTKLVHGIDGVNDGDVAKTNPLPTASYDATGAAINSLSSGAGQNGLMMAMGATNFVASTNNSTTAQLSAAATFTGVIESIFNQQDISVLCTTDQNGTLTLKQYIDAGGTSLISSWAFTITAGVPFSRSFVGNGNYFNLTFLNSGASATTTLNINAAYGTLSSATNLGNAPVSLNEVGGTALVLGQAAMASSLPVAFASNQAALPVTQAAITKGTQGTTGVTVQALNDAGRNIVTYYSIIPVLATATDTLYSLTGTKSGATVAATATPAVVTTGKTLRITRFSASYIATATSGYAIARLRFNTAGVVAITSPVAGTLAVGAGTPATANSAASEDASIAEGKEFAAGTGIGISVQGFSAATATAVGYMFVSVSGYEY